MLDQVVTAFLSLIFFIIGLTIAIIKIPFIAIYFRLTKRSDLAELAMEGYLNKLIDDSRAVLDHIYDVVIDEV